MDLKVHENLEPIKDWDEMIEPEELLDECWFFGNLLCNNSRMFRSLSDPCTSSNHWSKEIFGEKSYEETYESIKKPSGDGESLRLNLVKAPSLPASMKQGIHESSAAKGGTDPGRSKSSRRILSKNNISLAPSLPTSLRTDEFQDEEVEFSMGKLIRQASMRNSDTRTLVKGVSPNSGTKRHQPTKKPETENIKMEGLEEIKTPPTMNQLRKQKSSSIVESRKWQDFGFDIKKKDTLNPHKISTIPGLREKHPLYLSEARRTHSSTPPVPKWGGNKSTEAMKEQIKFWARAVASNVHQEC